MNQRLIISGMLMLWIAGCRGEEFPYDSIDVLPGKPDASLWQFEEAFGTLEGPYKLGGGLMFHKNTGKTLSFRLNGVTQKVKLTTLDGPSVLALTASNSKGDTVVLVYSRRAENPDLPNEMKVKSGGGSSP